MLTLLDIRGIEERKSMQPLKIVSERNLWKSIGNGRYYLDYVFRNVVLRGKSFLDIGYGSGIMAVYAACNGAKLVVGLEPEGAGAGLGHPQLAREITQTLGLKQGQVQILSDTIQNYDFKGIKFDLILMHNSVNYLDEKACRELHISQTAKECYLRIFKKVYGLLNYGGTIEILDCSRFNFWPLLGLKNPICPRIQWEEHQPPELWVDLLHRCGLKHHKIQWTSFKTLRWLGRPLQNRFTAFLLTSHFRLVMHK